MNGSKLISSFYAQKKNLLRQSLENFSSSVALIPKIGIELEFYLLEKNPTSFENSNHPSHLQPQDAKCSQDFAFIAASPSITQNYITQLENFFRADALIYQIEKEQGAAQIEIKISHDADLFSLCKKIENVKLSAQKIAQENNLQASFLAQPFLDDCGSALQFNFSLHDKDDQNLFAKKDQLFFSTISGMLDSIDRAMVFYAPQEEDYLRFDLAINQALHKKGKFSAPTNISFGDNNRTTAIRVPSSKNRADKSDSRIEFRVAASNADPYLAIAALLISIEDAINKEATVHQSTKIFGNAFNEQYNLKKFAKNFAAAEEDFFSVDNLVLQWFFSYAACA